MPYPPPPTIVRATPDVYYHLSYLPLVSYTYMPYYILSISYYLWTTYDIYGLGCEIGTTADENPYSEQLFVFLDYGNPYQNEYGVLGTRLYNQAFISIDDIASTVVIFSLGFYNCTTNDSIVVAVGTNSSGGLVEDLIAQAHGEAWADMIININNSYNDFPGLSSRVSAVGANNIEPGFNPTYIPFHWLHGYNSINYQKRLYVIASADECPVDYPPTESHGYYEPLMCKDNWSQEDIYSVTWGLPSSWPFPEIYNSACADQWYRIGLYAYLSHNFSMSFSGTLTQLNVCLQLREYDPYHSYCEGTDYSPATGFYELYSRITGDPDHRIINSLIWATDMKRYGWP